MAPRPLADVWVRFLATPDKLCLDLRSRAHFDAGHIRHAVCIEGLEALRTRFSTLPPRHVPFLVVCHAHEAEQVCSAFVPKERWHIVGVIGVGDAHALTALHPLAYASLADLIRLAASIDAWIEPPTPDIPHLLFTPAPVVSRVVHQLIESRGSDPVTLLDLGCGAGRDVTFALVLAQRTSTRRWYATCVDRWRAALERAAQLLADYALLDRKSVV